MMREISELTVSKEIWGEYIRNQERKNKAFQRISETRREKKKYQRQYEYRRDKTNCCSGEEYVRLGENK